MQSNGNKIFHFLSTAQIIFHSTFFKCRKSNPSRKTLTTVACFSFTAQSKTVRPSLSLSSQFAFFSRRYDTSLGKPFLAASNNGDCSELSSLSTESGSSRNKTSIAFRRPLCAAICIGSCPFASLKNRLTRLYQMQGLECNFY